MARKRKVEPANTEIASAATAVEPGAAEATPVVSPEPTPVAATEGAIAAPEAEKPAKRRGGRRSKNASAEATEKPARKRSGRKPKDESAEPVKRGRRKAAEEKPAESSEKKSLLPRRSKMAIPDSMGIFIQYQGEEVDMTAIVEAVKADFVANSKHKRITSLKLYAKPEERAVYYVANDSYNGKISF